MSRTKKVRRWAAKGHADVRGSGTCPVTGRAVDVERCFACGQLKQFVIHDDQLIVDCRARHPTVTAGVLPSLFSA
jgi:hypothetical protein